MRKLNNKEEKRLKISECPAKDFDGHTDFAKLTPKQKVLWISSTNYFLFQAAKNNPQLGCASFFRKKQ